MMTVMADAKEEENMIDCIMSNVDGRWYYFCPSLSFCVSKSGLNGTLSLV